MKRWGFVFVLMLAIVALLVVGCEDGEEATPTPTATPEATPTATPEATPTPTPTATPEATPTPTATPPPGELADILGLTSAIQSVQFDMAMTAPGMPDITSKVWQKPGKSKTELSMAGQTIITYIDYDAQRLCAYIPAMGMVVATDFAQAPANPIEESGTIEQYQPTIIGSEILNGEDCLVFEWTAEGVTTKWWVSKADGFPRRIEITMPEGTTTIEYSNIEFVDIPDSEFEFPPECG